MGFWGGRTKTCLPKDLFRPCATEKLQLRPSFFLNEESVLGIAHHITFQMLLNVRSEDGSTNTSKLYKMQERAARV